MSLCDKCFAPGACCKGLTLSIEGGQLTHWDDGGEALILADLEARSLPFLPMEKIGTWESEGRAYSQWNYQCPKLGADGRCTIYEDRPDLCRTYEPRTDALCVHFHGESGDPTVGIDL